MAAAQPAGADVLRLARSDGANVYNLDKGLALSSHSSSPGAEPQVVRTHVYLMFSWQSGGHAHHSAHSILNIEPASVLTPALLLARQARSG